MQRITDADTYQVDRLIQARLSLLGFKERGGKSELSTILAFLYTFAAEFIQDVNALIEGSTDDLETLSQSVANIEVGIDHMRRTFMRYAIPHLRRLNEHIIALQEEDETEE